MACSALDVVFLVVLSALPVVLTGVLAVGLFGDSTSEEVVQAFREEGLEAGETQRIDREADRSLVSKTYKEQTNFSIFLLQEKCRGLRLHARVPGGSGDGARALRGDRGPVPLLRLRQV